MAKCTNCNKVISDYATKCKYCFSDQVRKIPEDHVLIVSTPNVEKYEIIEYYGWIYGEVVVPNGILGAITSGTFFTIDSLEKARSMAIDALKKRAKDLGANAVIGVDVDMSDLNGNGVVVSANGTAVYMIPYNLEQHEAKLRADQIKEEQAIQERKERIVELVNSQSSDSALSEFFAIASSFEKYHEVEQLWDDMKIGEIGEFSGLGEIIKKKTYIERMYGSRSDEVKQNLAKWATGTWD